MKSVGPNSQQTGTMVSDVIAALMQKSAEINDMGRIY